MKIVPEYWDESLECVSPEKLRDIRTLKMQKHLRYAYQNSLFYKKAFDKIDLRPDVIRTLADYRQDVPFLTHKQMIENQNAKPPFGDFLSVSLKDIRRIYCSPGPLMMPFSKSDMDDYINTTANGLYICGARRGDIVDITYAYQWDLAGTMLDDGFRRLGCAVIPGGTGMTRTHLHIMKHLGVTVIFAFPTFAMKLAKTARKMGVDPRNDLKVRLIIIRAEEVYGQNDKEILAEEFGAEVREMYGGAETGFVAAECPIGGGMHYFTDSIVEIIDPLTGRTAADDEGGEIVVTDLSRKAMPIIRYRTGDLTEGLNFELCHCGRTSPRMKRIVGRTGDIVRVKGVYLIPEQVKEVVGIHKKLKKFQIIVDRPRLEDRLLIKVESPDSEKDQELRKNLIEDLRAVTRLKADIDLVACGSIEQGAPILIDKRRQK
jgi:phenylacetate-CoA ligase